MEGSNRNLCMIHQMGSYRISVLAFVRLLMAARVTRRQFEISILVVHISRNVDTWDVVLETTEYVVWW